MRIGSPFLLQIFFNMIPMGPFVIFIFSTIYHTLFTHIKIRTLMALKLDCIGNVLSIRKGYYTNLVTKSTGNVTIQEGEWKIWIFFNYTIKIQKAFGTVVFGTSVAFIFSFLYFCFNIHISIQSVCWIHGTRQNGIPLI